MRIAAMVAQTPVANGLADAADELVQILSVGTINGLYSLKPLNQSL
jgi:hypothetical protein